jgi:tRNA A37 threonylcarbamoyladenosine dehydratase
MTPAQIAASLTKAQAQSIARSLSIVQRDAVCRGGIGDHGITTVRALMRKGVMYLHIDSPNGRCGTMKLTSLGQQVRAILMETDRG